MKNRVGEKWVTNEGYEVEIIEYFGKRNCTIKFNNGEIYYNIEYSNIKKGCVKNLLHKSVFSIGYLGRGKYSSKINNKITKSYVSWKSMLQRCYYDNELAYKDCSVHPDWHNFQVFSEWFEKNYNSEFMEGWCLDKDILVKNNKIYSPETCCFVPQEINKLLIKCDRTKKNLPIGVKKYYKEFQSRLCKNGEYIHLGTFKTPGKAFEAYKKAKEKHIKEIAKICKTLLCKRVYEALVNYKVEITD